MTTKLTRKEFHDKIFLLFENSHYRDYFESYEYKKLKYLQNRYKENFGIELKLDKIGDEVMNQLSIDTGKWDDITYKIWEDIKQKGMNKIQYVIDVFVWSARVLEFSFDFDDVGDAVEKEVKIITDYLINN